MMMMMMTTSVIQNIHTPIGSCIKLEYIRNGEKIDRDIEKRLFSFIFCKFVLKFFANNFNGLYEYKRQLIFAYLSRIIIMSGANVSLLLNDSLSIVRTPYTKRVLCSCWEHNYVLLIVAMQWLVMGHDTDIPGNKLWISEFFSAYFLFVVHKIGSSINRQKMSIIVSLHCKKQRTANYEHLTDNWILYFERWIFLCIRLAIATAVQRKWAIIK